MTHLEVGFYTEDTVKSGLTDDRQPASTVARTICEGNPNNRFPNNEKGVPAPIPARNFMQYTVDRCADEWRTLVLEELKKMVDKGQSIDVESIYKKLSSIVEKDIAESMREGSLFAALSQNTLSYRKDNGRMGKDPLIDSGELISKIKSRIV